MRAALLLCAACGAIASVRAPLEQTPAPGRACDGDGALTVCLDDATWSEASRRCASVGQRLAVVRDDATQSEIERLLRDAGALDTDAPWIGLRKQSDGLAWVDGRAATFTFFTPGEPNGGAGDACVHLNWPRGAGSWNDADCDANQSWTSYICQVPTSGG